MAKLRDLWWKMSWFVGMDLPEKVGAAIKEVTKKVIKFLVGVVKVAVFGFPTWIYILSWVFLHPSGFWQKCFLFFGGGIIWLILQFVFLVVWGAWEDSKRPWHFRHF